MKSLAKTRELLTEKERNGNNVRYYHVPDKHNIEKIVAVYKPFPERDLPLRVGPTAMPMDDWNAWEDQELRSRLAAPDLKQKG